MAGRGNGFNISEAILWMMRRLYLKILDVLRFHLRVKLTWSFDNAATSTIYHSQVPGSTCFVDRYNDGFVWGSDAYAA